MSHFVIVETKDGQVLFVRGGSVVRSEAGGLLGFQVMKLTRSKSHARLFSTAEAEDAASAINLALDIGFYSSMKLSYARVGAPRRANGRVHRCA